MTDINKIIEQVEKLSVLELNELVKTLEEKFGVTAAPAAVTTAAADANPNAPAEGEAQAQSQSTFNVILADAGANKISVIKAVREINQTLGLKEAKDLVESTPKLVMEGANKEDSEAAKKKLEDAGATVKLE